MDSFFSIALVVAAGGAVPSAVVAAIAAVSPAVAAVVLHAVVAVAAAVPASYKNEIFCSSHFFYEFSRV